MHGALLGRLKEVLGNASQCIASQSQQQQQQQRRLKSQNCKLLTADLGSGTTRVVVLPGADKKYTEFWCVVHHNSECDITFSAIRTAKFSADFFFGRKCFRPSLHPDRPQFYIQIELNSTSRLNQFYVQIDLNFNSRSISILPPDRSQFYVQIDLNFTSRSTSIFRPDFSFTSRSTSISSPDRPKFCVQIDFNFM